MGSCDRLGRCSRCRRRLILRATMRLDGPWITERTVQGSAALGSTGTLDTNGFDAELRGRLTQPDGLAGALTKIGAGTLLIRDARITTARWASTAARCRSAVICPKGGALTVGSSGTLEGVGSWTRAVTVNGSLSPGVDGAGVMELSSLRFNSGSTLASIWPPRICTTRSSSMALSHCKAERSILL
jgi:hypothetical protein